MESNRVYLAYHEEPDLFTTFISVESVPGKYGDIQSLVKKRREWLGHFADVLVGEIDCGQVAVKVPHSAALEALSSFLSDMGLEMWVRTYSDAEDGKSSRLFMAWAKGVA